MFNQLSHLWQVLQHLFLNNITDLIFIIIRPIQIFGDVIYTIDAILYIIVWIKANEQMRKVGAAWIERGNTTFNKIVMRKKPNVTDAGQPAEVIVENVQPPSQDVPIATISKQIPEPVVEDVESSIQNPPDVETIT